MKYGSLCPVPDPQLNSPGNSNLPHCDLCHPLPDDGSQVPEAEDTLWRLPGEAGHLTMINI